MALPEQLQTARMTGATLASNIPTIVGQLEQAIADILGVTVNVNVTASALSTTNAGVIAKALISQQAAPPVGIRIADSTNSTEFRLVLDNAAILIDENTGSFASPTWTNQVSINLANGLPTLAAKVTPSATGDLVCLGALNDIIAALPTQTFPASGIGVSTGTAWTTSLQVGTGANNLVQLDSNGKLPSSVLSNSFEKCMAYCSTAQTISSGSATKVLIDTAVLDPESILDATNHRITPTKAGYYMISGQVQYADSLSTGADDYWAAIYKNGSEYQRGEHGTAYVKGIAVPGCIIQFNGSTDYVELWTYQSQGASHNLNNAATFNTLSLVGPF